MLFNVSSLFVYFQVNLCWKKGFTLCCLLSLTKIEKNERFFVLCYFSPSKMICMMLNNEKASALIISFLSSHSIDFSSIVKFCFMFFIVKIKVLFENLNIERREKHGEYEWNDSIELQEMKSLFFESSKTLLCSNEEEFLSVFISEEMHSFIYSWIVTRWNFYWFEEKKVK